LGANAAAGDGGMYDSLKVPLALPFATTLTLASLKDQGLSAARAVPASSSDGRRCRNRILGFVECNCAVLGASRVALDWRPSEHISDREASGYGCVPLLARG
jgi:hypothetical protein